LPITAERSWDRKAGGGSLKLTERRTVSDFATYASDRRRQWRIAADKHTRWRQKRGACVLNDRHLQWRFNWIAVRSAAPHSIFTASRLFLCKTGIVHCVHLRQRTTAMIHCLPPFSKFLDSPLDIYSATVFLSLDRRIWGCWNKYSPLHFR